MIEFLFELIGSLVGLGITFIVLVFVGALLFTIFSGVSIAILGIPAFLLVLLIVGLFLPLILPLLLPILVIGAILWLGSTLFCLC